MRRLWSSSATVLILIVGLSTSCGSIRQIDRKTKATLDDLRTTLEGLREFLSRGIELLEILLEALLEALRSAGRIAEPAARVVDKTDRILAVLLGLAVLYYRRQIGRLITSTTGLLGLNWIGRRALERARSWSRSLARSSSSSSRSSGSGGRSDGDSSA